MKRLIATLAILTLHASSAAAQVNYIVTERALGRNQQVYASNSAGWFVTYDPSPSDGAYILYGPNGYQRDISAFVPKAGPDQTQGFGSISAIDPNGGVYIQQTLWTIQSKNGINNFSQKGDRIRKLSLDAVATTEFFSSNYTEFPAGSFINTQGQILQLNQSGPEKNSVTLRKIQNKDVIDQVITFPSMGVRSTTAFGDLDGNGNFVVSQIGVKKTRAAHPTSREREVILSGLCTGSFASQAAVCLEPRALVHLNAKNFTYVGMSGGSPVFKRINRIGSEIFVRLDPMTFKKGPSLRIPATMKQEFVSLAENGDLAALTFRAFEPVHAMKVIQTSSDGNKSQSACKLSKRVRFERLNIGTSVQALASGGLMIFGTRDDRPTMFQLTPSNASQIPTGVIGQCS